MPVLSQRLPDLQGSAVRAMLSAGQKPDLISFGGGLPAPDSFSGLAFAPPAADVLQYGPTEGEPALREAVAAELAALGLDAPADRVLILSGSQQGIDLAAKLAVDAGTPVAVETPSYLAALQVFRFFGARFVPFDRADPAKGWGDGAPALAYVNPTFQNPTGASWTAAERQALAQACDAHDVVLFEDDPYRDLAYEPCERRPVAARVERASWIYQGSFSKTLAPGLRLGFAAASPDLFPHLVRLKQAADLHANRLSQAIVLQHLADPARGERMARLVEAYRGKRDRFAAALERHLGGLADWEVPPGGLFFWVRLRGGVDPAAILPRALERGVLFTPGVHFLPEGGSSGAMRLNFSQAEPERAERGLAILGEVVREAARAAAA